MKMKKLITMITAGLLMAGCAEEVNNNRTDGDKRYITFSVSDDNTTARTPYASMRTSVAPWTDEQPEMAGVEAKVVEVETDLPTEYPLSLTITDEPNISSAKADITRGALLNSGDAASLEFGVTEFLTSNATSPLFSNSKPAHQSTLDDGRELFKANEFWEYDSYDGISYDFYAYAPWVNGSGSGITLSNENRTITYDATGVAVNNQPDLMTARKWTSSYVGAIPLNFQHRLCAIQIKTTGTWAEGYHVSGVKFTNVISSGTFDIDTDKDDAWTSKGAADDYVVTGFTEADAANVEITGATGSNWLMLPPQTLSDAKLSITMSDGSGEYTITAPVNASTWRAGHTVTYTVSPEAITTMTVNYPTGTARSWQNGSTPVAGPVTTYTTTDQFGLFVLDKDNKIFISNQRITPTAGDAAASRTLDIPSLFKSKQFKYFLMYPYIDNASLEALVGTDNYNNYYKLDGTGRPANADAFFAEVIENWNPVNDQSTEATFKAQDLQIAKLSGDHFDMIHKMGLLACALPDGITSNDVITYDGNSYDGDAEGEKWTKIDSKCTTMTWNASTTFTSSTDKPYNAGSVLYYVAKPTNGAIAFSATADSNHYSWSVSGASTTVSTANAYKNFTIASPNLSEYYNKKVWEFSYTGAGKTWVAPSAGTYTMECWGGGYGASSGCRGGGYVSGDISLIGNMTLYVYVGAAVTNSISYVFNGGGPSSTKGGSTGPTGCGATDIRTTGGTWSDVASLRARIIVGGGGTSCSTLRSNSASAGGLTGYQARHTNANTNYDAYCGRGGGQTGGGAVPSRWNTAVNGTAGSFGMGGKGGASVEYSGSAGGGGGWYGGSGASGAGYGSFGGGGGSSFISGHPYCNGINSSGTHQGAGNPSKVLYQGSGEEHTIIFTNTLMIDGGGYRWTTSSRGSLQQMPNPAGGYYASGVGHSGAGFARITFTYVN